ncbi:MAG: CRTAC1 family protein [Pirellulales bacterium]
MRCRAASFAGLKGLLIAGALGTLLALVRPTASFLSVVLAVEPPVADPFADDQAAKPSPPAKSVEPPSADGAAPAADLLGSYLPRAADAAVDDYTLADDPQAPRPQTPATYQELLAERQKLDDTVWKGERLAQEHERAFVSLWDDLLATKDPYTVLRAFPFDELRIGGLGKSMELDWGIRLTQLSAAPTTIKAADWPAWLARLEEAGFQIVETEWHHSKFDPPTEHSPAKSAVATVLHVKNDRTNTRYIVRGSLGVEWAAERDARGNFKPARLTATDFRIAQRQGEPCFEPLQQAPFDVDVTGRKAPTTIHPILCYDLNGDGLSEIIVGGYNLVYWNQGGGRFKQEKFCEHGAKHANSGLIADFTGDGVSDYLCGVKSGPLLLFVGAEGGKFPTPPRPVTAAGKLLVPTSLSCGDIDGDGDLEVFVGQLRPPYLKGKVPVPFYDANDGFPAYLLLNDGQGNFSDATDLAGLTKHRFRRTFSSTFTDLDADGDQDLMVVSDFCGLDVYYNDGQGQFTDVTDQVAPQRRAFGMSHTFGDYNLDGRLDFYMIGMSSTTARRLDHMKLRREDRQEYAGYRRHMGYGNRMLLASDMGYEQAPFNADVARTGWSWGSTTLDFDNDGDPDIFVGNGQLSGKSTKDYCTHFWCHDIYVGNRQNDPAVKQLFTSVAPQLDGSDWSWNGYEHDALFMNRGGTGFLDIGFLMDVGFEFDTRCVLSDDVDGDGRVDLLVEEYRIREGKSILHVLRNRFGEPNHWIGFKLHEQGPFRSAFGVEAVLTLPEGKRVARNLAGHSVWAQHANTIHFGLGKETEVQSAELTWPDGTKVTLDRPQIDRYHAVTAPPK